MKTLLLLALVLAASAACFVVRGLPALAAADKAHADLLRREHAIQQTEASLPPHLGEELAALRTDRDDIAALAARRLALLREASPAQGDAPPEGAAPAEVPPTLEALLAAGHDPLLADDTRLAARLREQARASPHAEQALAKILAAVGSVQGVQALAITGDAQADPVPGVADLEQLHAQLVLVADLRDVLSVLERLCPAPGAGWPEISVVTSSLRRIEPDHWGSGTTSEPPVRLQADLAIHFETAGSAPP